MLVRTTVRLPKELFRRAKQKAVAEGRTLSTLIEEGLHLVLKQPRVPAGKRILPRVSTASGGPMPGIDLDSFSALQELEDLEYLEWMKRFT
jgi:hypothetical protein